VIVRIIEPGEIIGVAATLAGKPHEFTAETISECQVNFVERDQFREFVRAHHDVCLQVVGQLAMKYSLMLKALRPLVSRSVATRLAKLLLDWSSGEAAPGAAARVVSPSLTHESIAQLVGSSRETVTRLLSIMKQLRILQVTGPQIAIRDKAALKVLGHVD
jgi:CRP/FNR family transcriptional regulator